MFCADHMVGEYRSPHLWGPFRRRIELMVGNARLLLLFRAWPGHTSQRIVSYKLTIFVMQIPLRRSLSGY